MAASFVADLFTNPVTATTASTTIAGATNTAVASGDTIFLFLSARGGTTTAQSVTISGLPVDAVIEGNGAGGIGTLQTSRTVTAGSPAVACLRVYLPSGMSSATTITGTWAQSASRKVMDGVVWTGVANANLQTSQVAEGSGSPVTCGTTGASTTTTGVHCVAWGLNSTLGTNSGASETDTEGSMTERTDKLVGASTFHYLMAADNVVTAAHAGGETATITITNAIAGWAGVQAIWDGAATGTAYTDSGTITTTFAFTSTDAAGSIDAATITITPVLSSTNTIGSVDSGTLAITPVLSSVDAAGSVDSGTLSITPVLSATEIFTPAGAGGIAYTDAGTLTAAFAFSGADSIGSVDSGTLAAAFALSAATSVGYSDAATLTTTFALSATTTTGYADTGTLTLAFVLAASTGAGAVDAATLTVGFVLTATEVYSSASAIAPPTTVQTFLVGSSGLTRARSALSATTATGSNMATALTGSNGATHATGTSGKTVV